MVRTRAVASFAAVVCLLVAGATAQAQVNGEGAPEHAHLLDAAVAAALELERARPPAAASLAIAPEPARPRALPVLYASLGALQGLDIYTTRKGLALGAHETNPIMRHDSAGTLVALKTASTMASILATEKLWKKNRAAAVTVMTAVNVLLGAVVVNNSRVVRELGSR